MADDERIEDVLTDWAMQARAADQRDRLDQRASNLHRENELRTLASTLFGAGSFELAVTISTRAGTSISGVPTKVGADAAWLRLSDQAQALVRYDSIVSVQVALDPARWPMASAPNDDSAEDARFEFRTEIALLAENRVTATVETEDGHNKRVTLWSVSDELIVGDGAPTDRSQRMFVTIAIQSVAVVRVSG